MKISMFTNTYLPHVGGVARSVSTFVEDLRRQGHLVQVIAPSFPEHNPGKEEYVVRLPAIQNFNGSDFSVKLPLPGTIDEEIADFSPDIIHSHHPFLLGDSAVRVSRSLELPLVFTHHTLYEQYTHYVPLDSELLKRFVKDLATQYANLCNYVIAPSSAVKTLLLKRGVQSSIGVLPTGINLSFFNSGDGKKFRQIHGIDEQIQVIGHLGRLAPEKNLLFLARGVADAVEQFPNARFMVAGEGSAREDIVRVFEELNLKKSLLMVGNITGRDLADCYAAMDVFVFASKSETQGLVLAEALAASVPVIALSASGVDDVIENRVNGILLEAQSSQNDFTVALVDLLKDGERLQSLKAKSTRSVEKFSHQSCSTRLASIYQQIIHTREQPFSLEIDGLDSLLLSIKAEWELLQEKTAAALNSLAES